MLRSIGLSDVRFRRVGWFGIAAALACLGLASCSNLTTYREDAFRDIAPSDYIRQVNPADRQTDHFGVSDRARDVERNFGAK